MAKYVCWKCHRGFKVPPNSPDKCPHCDFEPPDVVIAQDPILLTRGPTQRATQGKKGGPSPNIHNSEKPCCQPLARHLKEAAEDQKIRFELLELRFINPYGSVIYSSEKENLKSMLAHEDNKATLPKLAKELCWIGQEHGRSQLHRLNLNIGNRFLLQASIKQHNLLCKRPHCTTHLLGLLRHQIAARIHALW